MVWNLNTAALLVPLLFLLVGLTITVLQLSSEHFSMEEGSVISTVRQTIRKFFGTSSLSAMSSSISSRSMSSFGTRDP